MLKQSSIATGDVPRTSGEVLYLGLLDFCATAICKGNTHEMIAHIVAARLTEVPPQGHSILLAVHDGRVRAGGTGLRGPHLLLALSPVHPARTEEEHGHQRLEEVSYSALPSFFL